MSFSERSIWTMVHGIALGGAAPAMTDLSQFPRAFVLSPLWGLL